MKNVLFLGTLIGITFLLSLTAAPSGAQMSLFKPSIDFGDLAQLSREGLETLRVNEYEVFLAQVALGGAGNEEKKAEEDLDKAEQVLRAKDLDLKAAKAEEKAAKKNQDEARLRLVAPVIKRAQEVLEVTKLMVQWKKAEVTARKAGVKRAKLAVQVAEAERDLARVSRLWEEKVPAAQKYSIAEYQKRLKEKQEAYDKARNAEEREFSEAAKAKAVYEQVEKR